MANPQRRVYWDACVFMDYFAQTQDKIAALDAIVKEARRGDTLIFTLTVTIAEVTGASHVARSSLSDADLDTVLDAAFRDTGIVQLVEFDFFVAERTRTLLRNAHRAKASLRSVDDIHLATAQFAKCDEVHTYDKKIHKGKQWINCPVHEPASLPHVLPMF